MPFDQRELFYPPIEPPDMPCVLADEEDQHAGIDDV
jgi:hypothetical protein